MPYQTNQDLPGSVKDHLPEHAQDIFRAAFNNAWKEYNHDEERSFRVAWGAVEREYHKTSSGTWEKDVGEAGKKRT